MSNQLPGDPSLPTPLPEVQNLIEKSLDKGNYSVEDFFRTPEKSSFSLSPDGNYVAYLAPIHNRKNIIIQKIDGSDKKELTSEKDRDIAGFGWANDQRLIYIKDSGGDENYKLYSVSKDGGEVKDLTPFDKVTIQIIDDLEEDDDHLIIGLNKNNPQLFEPYRINIVTGELTQLAVNDNPLEPIVSWQTDHDGKLRLASRMKDGTTTILMYRDTEEEDFADVVAHDFKESLSPLFFDFEIPHVVFASSNVGRDKMEIVRFDLKEKQEIGDPLFSHPTVDVGGLSYSRKRKVITSTAYVTDKKHRHFFDEETRSIYQYLEEEFEPMEVSIVSQNKNEDKFLVRTYSDRSLGAYYFYDQKSEEVNEIASLSPWLDETQLSLMQPIQYQSRDGLTIHGYLSLPVNYEGPYPFVINPHGGPWVRDSWGFNPEVQLLCDRGIAVLQMNYRGSTGYGKEFWKKSFKQWGATMQDDITDGVKWLISEGLADPDRIAIYGGSYGGYATLAGVTFTPDLYKCAIDYVGVSNLFTFMKTIPPYWKPYLDMMYEMVGNPETDHDDMMARSPVFHVDKIQCPLMVIQGANDPRVNIDESDQIVSKLRQRGIEVPYIVKYDEGHGFRNEENRIEIYKIIVGFLEEHLMT